jgi:hypothetical protein
MGDTVFVNMRATVHKGSSGQSIAFPDVCLCPPTPPAGPIPTPLPNTVMAADMTGGASTVLIEGNPAGHAQSYFSKSTGNEVAKSTGGGVVTANVQGSAYFGSYAMNVTFEGQPAVRHLDLLTHNHLAAQPGNTPPAPWMSAMAPPSTPPETEVYQGDELDTIHFAYVNDAGEPIAGLAHSVEGPDQKVDGELLGGGRVHLDGVKKGSYTAKLSLAGTTPSTPPSTPSPPPHAPGHLKLTSRTVAASPPNRARLTIGVGEKVQLTVTGATGNVTWRTSGQRPLSSTTGTTVTLTGNGRAESGVVILAEDSGCDCNEALIFDVIEPRGVRMEQVGGTFHTHNVPSVGIQTDIFITPATVSFKGIEIVEKDCTSVVTGFFSGTALDGVHHAGHGAGAVAPVVDCVPGKGSKVHGQDTAATTLGGIAAPFSAGTFDWPIPWAFRVQHGDWKVFTTVHQDFTINPAGDMTVGKGGATGFAALGDATSTF